VVSATIAHADALRRVPLYRTGIVSDGVGTANIVVANVYGPATADLVSCSGGAAYALSYSSGVYKRVWYTGDVDCTAVAAGDVNGDGSIEVVVAGSTNEYSTPVVSTVQVFTPHGYGPARAAVQLPVAQAITDVAVANVDADPAIEIVVLTSANAYVYNAATLALEWTATGRGGYMVAVGDLEADGAPDIVINGSEGHVLNAAAQEYKWGYVGGFGHYMAVGDVDSDGRAEIVGGTHNNVRIVHGDTFTTSTFTTSSYQSVAAIAVGDGNGDGQLEIITGDDQWGAIRGWNVTGVQQWYVNNPEHGVSAVAVADPDGDGFNEAVWGAGLTSSGTDALFVGNPSTHAVEWQTSDQDGSFYSTAADLDRDGDLELIVAMGSSDSGYAPGAFEVHDLQGNVLGSGLFPSNSWDQVMDVAAGQLDNDAALEFVLINSDGLAVYDGVTYALEFNTVAGIYSNTLSNLAPVLVRNVDGDAMDEIIIATASNGIQILNGASAFVQASAGPLNGAITDMAIADLDGDSVLDLVVGTTSGFYVLRASNLSQRIYTALSGYKTVAATAGEFALSYASNNYPYPSTLVAYAGGTLLERWRCDSLASQIVRSRYVTLDGTARLITADSTQLLAYPAGGSGCPATIAGEFPQAAVSDLEFADVTGDGRPEMLLSTYGSTHVDLFGLDTDPRGDADSDDVVHDADMDALSRWFYGDRQGIGTGADVNGDFSVAPDDLFYLINYRRGTGAAPPQ